MSKITFRADDNLVERLEACDASKSEVMRKALRTHLDRVGDTPGEPGASNAAVDDALTDRVDDLIDDRLDAALADRLGDRSVRSGSAYTPGSPGEINVNVSLDGPSSGSSDADEPVVTRETATDADAPTRKTRSESEMQTRASSCGGCGETVPERHVYCPNCGEKRSHRAFCECGDELRTDWAFCPGCGRRTPAADVLNDR
ncbi:double zinc ribbon domain-containing protein [Halorubrum trueperi]|uniref:Zinc ribbon domain-containing protein n=1 Tax=Halorubrum trueperi TaxID=2004704 RepID=A0ABD5UH63_9EURY